VKKSVFYLLPPLLDTLGTPFAGYIDWDIYIYRREASSVTWYAKEGSLRMNATRGLDLPALNQGTASTSMMKTITARHCSFTPLSLLPGLQIPVLEDLERSFSNFFSIL
jgi:hypothetical protein